MSDAVPQGVQNILNEEAPIAQSETAPIYRVDPTTKVPVSKHYGTLWKGRIDAATSARKHHLDSWDEAIRYYNNAQGPNRTSEDNRAGNRYFSSRRNTQWSETENIVYANTRAIMPAVYTKNPQVEFTAHVEGQATYVAKLEKIVNTIAGMREPPGLNLKVHARQAILSAELTNLGWIEFGYTERAQSAMVVTDQIDVIAQELADAKDVKRIRELEGQLQALEEELDLLNPPGPWTRYRPPHEVLVDPDCAMPDFSDAKWMAVREYYPTVYLNAKYGDKQDNGEVKSIYEPTHVLSGGDASDDDIKSFKLFQTDADASAYGYTEGEQLRRAHRTACWRVLDKVTRRVFLFADNKWDWPVWVENDPYGLPNFFNLEPLYFNTTPLGAIARSNVSYYLDQQDAVNEIHDEFRRARQDVRENILYDSRWSRETVLAWLQGSSPNAQGVEVPDGRSMRDMILEKPNALLKAAPLFDMGRIMQSVDRISGVSDVLRNAQFKTNTTNKAIENYNSTTAMRLDEKIDAIEDFIGRIGYGVAFIIGQLMPAEQVAQIIGEAEANDWQTFDSNQLRHLFSCNAVGGSTQKPTSSAKKQMAMEMAELLSKFAQFSPGVVLEITLGMFNEAFDDFVLPTDAFARLQEEVAKAMERGNSIQGAPGGAPPGGTDSPPAAAGGDMSQLEQLVDALPPPLKLALGEALARGAPVREALPQIIAAAQQGAQGTVQ